MRMMMILLLGVFLIGVGARAEEVKCLTQIENAVNGMGYFPVQRGMLTVTKTASPLVFDAAVYGSGNCDNSYFFQITFSDEYCTIQKVEFLGY